MKTPRPSTWIHLRFGDGARICQSDGKSVQFDRAQMQRKVAALAARGVFVGTSSWKYGGWRGLLYDEARYVWRGKFAETRFDRNCLTEYGEVFKSVCVDAAYYAFPSERYLEGLASMVPGDFRFSFKVTDEITVKQFPNLARFSARAGQTNQNFLNADLFNRAFLKPCERIRSNVGILMFEFSRFHSSDYRSGAEFVAALDVFLSRLAPGWQYGIEMRNQQWLSLEYFACLARHNVTHVFNSWEAMPPVTQQMALPGSRTNPTAVAARFLMKPGRKYTDAVESFAPYDRVQEVNEEARSAIKALIDEGVLVPGRKTYLYVNNRLEGCALGTIASVLAWFDLEEGEATKHLAAEAPQKSGNARANETPMFNF